MSNYSQLSDEQLVNACRAGDEAAWDMLVGRYERLVYTIPIRYGLSAYEVQDVFQSVWLSLLQHLPALRQPERLSAWLVTTARRECWERRRGADYERTQNPQAGLIGADAWIEEASTEEVVTFYERQAKVREALKHLDDPCRRLLWQLYYDAGRPSYTDIAAKLRIPIGSIGPTRARCLEKLRRLLEE
ncbi:MAG: sigma-70 family RNA polymerase sigma factor [Chloroflexi bacterium]|nr:sigma-70 family RNA polymerase sigma factor [Chloroflexota bacterium]MCI0579234.1 sigma-70 family RNA polymerase sigma factor [Chloroflexota bacterium]MCI0647091.1 sigma-70 family RNA polymerase sigma factor [Chloroflexota bacterium]MCI0725865.1 sigma-70 family RNA polymerase sigma factor [Chloroflexota bacterium]